MKRISGRVWAVLLAISLVLGFVDLPMSSVAAAESEEIPVETIDETSEMAIETEESNIVESEDMSSTQLEIPETETSAEEDIATSMEELQEETDTEIADEETTSEEENKDLFSENIKSVTTQSVVASGFCGSNVEWTLDEAGTLWITGNGAMDDYEFSYANTGAPWDTQYRDAIKKIDIGEGVTHLGASAFYRYKNLEEVSLSSTICTIGDYAFYTADKLSNVDFSQTKLTEIGGYAFYQTAISGVLRIPDTVVAIGGGAFQDCANLTEVVLPSKLNSLGGYAFAFCDNLTKVNIPKSLENNIRVNATNFRCFKGAPLSSVSFEEGITKIPAGLFRESFLSNITIPSSVTVLEDYALAYCEYLTSVVIPEGVTDIGYSCFAYSGLKTVSIPSTIKSCKYGFDGCQLVNLTVKNKSEFEFSSDFNVSAIHGYSNSYIHEYALKMKIPFYDLNTGLQCAQTDYVISYRLNGGTNNPNNPVGYNAGETVTFLEPSKENVKFGGWFQKDNTKITDVSGQSVTVYAKWIEAGDFWVEEIEEQTYEGKAVKPEVLVYAGNKLLEENKDYTISYKNNTKAAGESDGKKAPSITITGKGNYSGKETITFTIAAKDISEADVTADSIIAKSNNKVQKPVPVVTYNGKKLKNKTDFTVEYPDTITDAYKKPGTYTILVKGKGNYTGEREVTFTITENNLMSKVTVSKIKNQSYTGSEITPVFTVKNGKNVLVEGTDYTVNYQNNKEIGTATILLTGIGTYSGEKKVTFKITGGSISKAKVTGVPKSVEYTGETITVDSVCWGEKPVLTMTVNKEVKTLVEGTDYTISYQKNTDKGTASILFTGINGYSGTLKKTFKINAYNLTNDSLGKITYAMDTQALYAKGGSKPKPTVKFGDTVLKEGTDYTLSYKNNTKVNDGSNAKKLPTVTIKGKGNYSGSIALTYTIDAQSLSVMSISVPDKVYKNKKNAYKSTPKITDLDGKALKTGTDYEKAFTYSYKNAVTLEDGTVKEAGEIIGTNDIVPAGTVIVVTVTGKGNYKSDTTLQGEYRVVKSNISNAKVQIPSQTYTGEEICPGKDDIRVKVGGVTLQDSDYEIVGYENNINKGKAKVTIKGVGNYGGTKTVTFTIKARGFLWWWK